jgi:hypothetical protein
MAYASAVAINPVAVVQAGVSSKTLPTTPTATHGNKFKNDNRTYLEVDNAGASPITVTIDTPGNVKGLGIEDLVVTVNNGDRKKIGPFSDFFNQSDGYVWAVCSASTSVTIGAFRVPKA